MRLKSYLSLIRSRVKVPIYYSFNVVLSLIASSKLNGSDLFTFGRNLLLSIISTFAIVLSVYIYNDYIDVEIDRLNKLDRPLVTGEASEKEARHLIIILSIIGLTTAFILDLRFFLLALTYFALFTSYSFPSIRLKSKFLLNKITVATGVAITYLMGGIVGGDIQSPIFLMVAYGFVGGLSTNILMDFRDIEGDKKYEVKTFSAAWNPNLTIRFAMALISLLGATIVIAFFQLGLNIAFIILASCGFVGWIYILYPLFHRWNEPSYVANLILKKVAPIGLFIQTILVMGILI